MFLTSLLLSYFVARMVSNPIIKLNEITNEISHGKLNKRVDIKTNDEIGTLADSFNKMINIPIIASGGAGKTEHFTEVFQKAGVDAALAASVFHYGEILIPDLKKELKRNNIPVRI